MLQPYEAFLILKERAELVVFILDVDFAGLSYCLIAGILAIIIIG